MKRLCWLVKHKSPRCGIVKVIFKKICQQFCYTKYYCSRFWLQVHLNVTSLLVWLLKLQLSLLSATFLQPSHLCKCLRRTGLQRYSYNNYRTPVIIRGGYWNGRRSHRPPATRLSHIWPYISVTNKDRVLKFKICSKQNKNVSKKKKKNSL